MVKQVCFVFYLLTLALQNPYSVYCCSVFVGKKSLNILTVQNNLSVLIYALLISNVHDARELKINFQ